MCAVVGPHYAMEITCLRYDRVKHSAAASTSNNRTSPDICSVDTPATGQTEYAMRCTALHHITAQRHAGGRLLDQVCALAGCRLPVTPHHLPPDQAVRGTARGQQVDLLVRLLLLVLTSADCDGVWQSAYVGGSQQRSMQYWLH